MPRTNPEIILRANYVYWEQQARCNRMGHKRYKSYGAKGIKVMYTWKEFKHWYIENLPKYLMGMTHVARIDHTKNYCLDNIEMQFPSENSKEIHTRYKYSAIRIEKEGTSILFRNMSECARFLHCSVTNVSSAVSRAHKCKGYTIYKDDIAWQDKKKLFSK